MAAGSGPERPGGSRRLESVGMPAGVAAEPMPEPVPLYPARTVREDTQLRVFRCSSISIPEAQKKARRDRRAGVGSGVSLLETVAGLHPHSS